MRAMEVDSRKTPGGYFHLLIKRNRLVPKFELYDAFLEPFSMEIASQSADFGTNVFV